MEAETTNTAQSESSDRSSVEVKPLSVSESIVIEEDDKVFLEAISVCGKCGENLCNKASKFLSCLHTFCSLCVKQLEVVDVNNIKCHICGVQTHPTSILDNLFDLKEPPSAPPTTSPDEVVEADEADRKCMCCEDDVDATFFCVECSEWLCDQCTQAHKRVKLTKDHTLEERKSSNKNGSSSSSSNNNNNNHNKLFMCSVHAAEELKLYCCTCGVMTCRDCQLLEHKDHQYQFIQEAAGPHRERMRSLLVKVREKQRYIENAKKLIEKRNNDIAHKEELVINEMKLFSSSLIAQIHQQSMQLATDLQLIREAKRTQLGRKELEIRQLCERLETGIGFCEHLLTIGDDKHLLYLYHLVVERLKAVLMTRCEVPNPNHVIDLHFKPNTALSTSLDKLGCLILDGEPFHKPSNSQSTQPPHKAKTTLYNLISQQMGPGQPQLNSLMNMLPDGKFSHWLKRQSDQRRPSTLQQQQQHMQQHMQQQQQQQQLHHQQQQQLHLQQLQQQQMQKMISLLPPDEQAAHLPNQSGTITSSNTLKRRSFFHPPHQSQHPITIPQHSPHQQQHLQHLQMQQKQQQQLHLQQQLIMQHQQQQQQQQQQPQPFPGTFPVPNFHSPSHLIHHHQQQQQQNLINLNLLQQERAKKQLQQQQQQQQQPIVIEPTNIEPMFSPHSLQDFNKHSDPSLQHVKKEGRHSLYSSGGGVHTGGAKSTVSRSPTPRIESTTSLDYQAHSSHNDPSFDSLLEPWSFDDLIASSENHPDLSDRASLRTSSRLRKRRLGGDDDEFELEYGKKSASPRLDKDIDGFCVSGRLSLDPSEDYCAVCNNGGELLCCDGCPKVFHLHCHVSQLSSAPSDKWFCGLCTSDAQLRIDGVDDDATKKRHHNLALSPKEEKVCKKLLLEMYCDIASAPFHEAVSKTVHNYYKLIAHPIDMRVIRSKLGPHHFDHYTTPSLFIVDVLLLFANCAAFNSNDSDIAKAGRKLRSNFIKRCNDLLPNVDINHLINSSPLLTNVTKSSNHNASQKGFTNGTSASDTDGVGDDNDGDGGADDEADDNATKIKKQKFDNKDEVDADADDNDQKNATLTEGKADDDDDDDDGDNHDNDDDGQKKNDDDDENDSETRNDNDDTKNKNYASENNNEHENKDDNEDDNDDRENKDDNDDEKNLDQYFPLGAHADVDGVLDGLRNDAGENDEGGVTAGRVNGGDGGEMEGLGVPNGDDDDDDDTVDNDNEATETNDASNKEGAPSSKDDKGGEDDDDDQVATNKGCEKDVNGDAGADGNKNDEDDDDDDVEEGVAKKMMMSFDWTNGLEDDESGVYITQSNGQRKIKLRRKLRDGSVDGCSHGNQEGSDEDAKSLHFAASV